MIKAPREFSDRFSRERDHAVSVTAGARPLLGLIIRDPIYMLTDGPLKNLSGGVGAAPPQQKGQDPP